MKSIKNLEMQNHISELITIDNFEAKLGNDEDVSVVKLQTDNKEVAQDLVHFIETGNKFVLDADNSPAKNDDKRYDVFVELERNQNLPKQIVELVRDVEQVSGMLPWRFIFHKQNKSYKLSEENLNTVIPTSASQYKFLTDENIEEDINKFFESASVITKRIKGKNVMLKKAFTKHEMIIESFDRDIQGTYKIDRESSEQASYINHWLGGGYSVVKVDDLFKITKGTKSILTKIKEL
tara:strand:- start:518 stop:1228 length:711 start_codon:yes stop_codon:yes gene_type:complete